jgi:hypothetical protein
MATRQLVSDLRGASRLAIAATTGVTELVEAMHHTIGKVPAPLGRPVRGRPRGITGVVYATVKGVTRLVGGGIDAALALLPPLLRDGGDWNGRDRVLAALNGVLGDYLARTGNPLAIEMRLRSDGQPLELRRDALRASLPDAKRRLVVLVHGLCMSDRQWARDGHEHGRQLAKALDATALHLNYNTGLHVSTNGRQFAALLEQLVRAWPVPVSELVIVGHSMGGLVARSATRIAQDDALTWRAKLRSLVFLGTPHHGAPLERGGHWIDVLIGASPYTAAFNRLGRIRSAGITDLRHGSVLDEDWAGQDRFAHGRDARVPLPLPDGVDCYAIAATAGKRTGPLAERLIGDGLVPLDSALGRHEDPRRALAFPASHTWIAYQTHHLDLLASKSACRRMVGWLGGEPATATAATGAGAGARAQASPRQGQRGRVAASSSSISSKSSSRRAP